MGPKMCALAGSRFDGAFLNWMTPEFAAGARESVHSGAADAGREPPPVFGYVRTAVGDDAKARLAKEESFYRDLHDGYRRQFARLDRPKGTVGVAEADASAARTALDEYDALDVVVVRGLASATLEAMGAVAAAAAPTCCPACSRLPRAPSSSPRRRSPPDRHRRSVTRAAGSPTLTDASCSSTP